MHVENIYVLHLDYISFIGWKGAEVRWRDKCTNDGNYAEQQRGNTML